MKLKDFSGGLNTFDPNINIADNQCASLLNVCYEEGDILRSRYGFTRTRSVTNVRGLYNWYKNDVLHQIYTTTSGLYDNGSLVTASFTGAFHAQEYGTLLYLANGDYNKRYDGTTLYNWGVAAPNAPTVAASTHQETEIDTFEATLSVYERKMKIGSSSQASLHKETEASLVYAGSESLRVKIKENTGFWLYRDYTAASGLNLGTLGGSDGSADDYITMKVRIDTPEDIRFMQLLFEDKSSSPTTTVFSTEPFIPGGLYTSKLPNRYEEGAELGDQLQLEYLPNAPGHFVKLAIPRADFKKTGTGDWTDIRRVRVDFLTQKDMENTYVTVHLDDAVVQGCPGVDLGFYGKFACVAGYYNSTRDEYYGVSTESSEIELDVQGVRITGVPATFDDQADKYIVWIRKTGSILSNISTAWTNWYKLAEISEGTTSADAVNNNIDVLYENDLISTTGIYPANTVVDGVAYTRLGTNNLPPPTASNILMHRGKMFFAVDDKVYHSKPLAPWAVPAGHYIIATSDADDVQAFYSDGMDLSVFSKAKDFSYLMAGEYDSQNIYQGTLIEAREFKRGCIAPHSVSDGIYASAQGLCYWDGQQGALLTKRIKPTYRAISGKTSLHGVVWEDLYLLVNPGGDSIVCEQYDTPSGKAIRFYLWAFSSTARCCAVDKVTNLLYIGTDTGIYKYDTSAYKDTEGNFTFRARTKNFEYAPEDSEEGLERFTVHCNTGGNGVVTGVYIDDVSHGSVTLNRSTRGEEEAFVDLGGQGSFVQARFNGTVNQANPVRIYGIEVS